MRLSKWKGRVFQTRLHQMLMGRMGFPRNKMSGYHRKAKGNVWPFHETKAHLAMFGPHPTLFSDPGGQEIGTLPILG